MSSSTTLIAARDLEVRYDAGRPAVAGVNLDVGAGEVVALLGANGAGKSTTLNALAGFVPVSRGSTELFGEVTTSPLHRRVRSGLALLPEERSVFAGLTVRDNLRLGRGEPEAALALFPELEPHLDRAAGLLSGGQQQMLALGRVLAARPRVLLADELSLGLAPVIVRRLLAAIRTAADAGLAVLLVEQHVNAALAVADRALVLRQGQVVHAGAAHDLASDPDLLASLYLAGGSRV